MPLSPTESLRLTSLINSAVTYGMMWQRDAQSLNLVLGKVEPGALQRAQDSHQWFRETCIALDKEFGTELVMRLKP